MWFLEWLGARGRWGGVALAALALFRGPIHAQSPPDALPGGKQKTAVIHPREFGFDLPDGEVRAAQGENVETHDAAHQPVVARPHVRVGDAAVVMLPGGELVARQAAEFHLTQRPFQPLAKEKITENLAAEFPNFQIKQTKHYFYVYNTSEEFFQGTSRILETMLPGVTAYAEAQKIDCHDLDAPLVVVMFATEEAFQKYRRMPRGVVAYYHTLSNRVFMYEQSRLAGVRPDLAQQQAISTVAHEGAHQILHNIGVQQRLSIWPIWLSEGLAEYFAPTSMGKNLRWKGAGQVNDLRMFELEQYLKGRAAEKPNGQMIEQTVGAARLTSTGYASAWALTHYLAKARRNEFNQYVRAVSKLRPLEGAVELTPQGQVRGNRELFTKLFGTELVEMEKRLIVHLKNLPYTDPFADLPHFVAAVTYRHGKRPLRELQTFHSQALAEKWVDDIRGKLPQEQLETVEAHIQVFPNRVTAETFAAQWLGGR